MSCEIVIRKARNDDEAARAALVRSSFAGYQRDAFFLFFFQELTLQAGVLMGAVLFIFFGVSLRGLLLLLPAIALIVLLAVYVTHAALADKQVQDIRKELVGFVAELHGPLLVDPHKQRPNIVLEEDWQPSNKGPVHTQVVGTVSVSEFWGPETAGWLHAFTVHVDWRRRGVGRALLGAARGWARRGALRSLHAALSELQPAAGGALRAAGFRPRGAYHRRLLGPQLTLALSHLALDVTDGQGVV